MRVFPTVQMNFAPIFSLALAIACLGNLPSHAFEKSGGVERISAAELPKEARETLQLVRKGGPFPYSQDGVTFSNRERILPKEARGFYREYTVKTPGVRSRGARRIICGGGQQTICYYTADHYASFRQIRE